MRNKTRAARLADHHLTEKCDTLSLLVLPEFFSLPHG
jgi:hypothetical protein